MVGKLFLAACRIRKFRQKMPHLMIISEVIRFLTRNQRTSGNRVSLVGLVNPALLLEERDFQIPSNSPRPKVKPELYRQGLYFLLRRRSSVRMIASAISRSGLRR